MGGGRLRGFVTMTTFSTWQRSFRWDSRCPQAGITPLDRAKPSSSELAAAAAAASASVGVGAAGGGAAAVESSLARSVSAGSNSSSGNRRKSRSSSHVCSSASMPLMSPTKESVQTRDDAAALASSLIPPLLPSWPSTDSGPLASALMRLATYEDTYRERVRFYRTMKMINEDVQLSCVFVFHRQITVIRMIRPVFYRLWFLSLSSPVSSFVIPLFATSGGVAGGSRD